VSMGTGLSQLTMKRTSTDALLEEIGELREQLTKKQGEFRLLDSDREMGRNVSQREASIDTEIKEITVQLKARLKALLVLQQELGIAQKNITFRFFDVPPSIAIATFLEEQGVPCSYETITQALVDGGAFIGNQRAIRNVKTAVKMDADLTSAGELVARKDWFKSGGRFQGRKLTEDGIKP
jgi:hypothetical protein